MSGEKRSYFGEVGAILVGLIAALLLRVWMPVSEEINYTAILIAIIFVISVIIGGYVAFRGKKDYSDD